MHEKVSIMGVCFGWKNLSLGVTVRHHSASLVMPISDPHDRFFDPHHTPMKDTYCISSRSLPTILLYPMFIIQLFCHSDGLPHMRDWKDQSCGMCK